MNSPPLSQIAVGVVVERRKAASPWIDFVWRAVGTLPDAPDMQPCAGASDDRGKVSVQLNK